jgi:ABC-type sugar transport system ATPase subunit
MSYPLMVGRTITDLFPKQEVKAGEVVLKVENLARAGSFHDVSFELRKGEILGMAGLVGAGRTNVARAIFGVEPATGGRIQIEGQEVAVTSSQQAIKLGLAYVPEDRQLHGMIPAAHYIKYQPANLFRYAQRGWLQESGTEGCV